jgi:integrase
LDTTAILVVRSYAHEAGASPLETWWTDFSVNGQRFRESLDTTDWREAQHSEKEFISQASQGKLAPSSQQFARLAFSEAADHYVADRRAHLARRSIVTEQERLKPLKAFFGAKALNHISADSIRQYINCRKDEGLSNRTINMEVGCLRVLKRAKRWHLVADELKPLPERRNVGRAMTHDEKVRLIKMAAIKPEWQVSRLAMTLALNTTMRGCELKGLLWRDVDFLERTLTIRHSKTAAGERVIPINADAMAAILELRERAKAFGGTEPLHYIFATCEGNKTPDPSKPMHSWRSAWRKLTRAIECPSCGQPQNPGSECENDRCRADISKVTSSTAGLRFHDLRHHAITELAESLASDQTIMSIAGHVPPRMLTHYSHVRLEHRRAALDALCTTGSQCHDTKHGTNGEHAEVTVPQVIENLVDVTGFEPATPCLQSRCSPS